MLSNMFNLEMAINQKNNQPYSRKHLSQLLTQLKPIKKSLTKRN